MNLQPKSGLMFIPPSMLYSLPVMNHASSEAKKLTSLAMASGVPIVFKGMRSCIALAMPSKASAGKPAFPKMGVLTGPGLTALTLIFLGASSVAAVLVNEFRAALLAA